MSGKKDLMEEFNKAEQALFDHVGFTPDWVVAPIDDCTENWWDTDGESVVYADPDKKMDLITLSGEHYQDEIYKQRFYDKWVYEGEEFTMIFCNPGVDGMKWFRVFRNDRRVTERILEKSPKV